MQENAVYGSGELVSLQFQPNHGEAIAVSNKFAMRLGDDIVLDGVVMWSEDVPRPNGMMMLDCPEGDATGAEIEACTVWRGVVYATDESGGIGLLPREGEQAAGQLLFPDLGWALKNAPGLQRLNPAVPAGDSLELSGCSQ